MKYQRGEVVEIPFIIPEKNKTQNHPAIIISNDEVYDNEGIYICVMVTHSDINDYFAFELDADMFLSPQNMPDGKAKAHLIAYIKENHIVKNSYSKKCTMKKVYVDKLVDFITLKALSVND
jgi:mRNA interferase MazF